MFTLPAQFQDFLSRYNYIDDIYEAMANDDPADVVMVALDVLRKTNNLPPIIGFCKSELTSAQHRNLGNISYRNGQYQKALIAYNKALLFAPKNSREMLLAYSNRSALFKQLLLWNACKIDIEKCFAMGCPPDLQERLLSRQEQIKPFIDVAICTKKALIEAANKCVNHLSMPPNSQIPCASGYVTACAEKNGHKVFASTDIKIGTVVATEQAYVSYTTSINALYACHFCQKKPLNLIPCDGCCYALFCDEECKNKCMAEFHVYECRIMDAINSLHTGYLPNLMLKSCLKLRTRCKTWNELIDASYLTGNSRLESSSIAEIYDANKPFSILTYRDDRPFSDGIVYNISLVGAAFLHYIQMQIPSFLPTDIYEKQQALRAMARIMMYLSVYQIITFISSTQNNVKLQKSNYGIENFGLFPFSGKLKNSCNPNLLAANYNNTIVLICIRPIKIGEELTLSYMWHRHDRICEQHIINIKRFKVYGTACDCVGHSQDMYDNKLTRFQKKFLSRFMVSDVEAKFKSHDVFDIYPMLLTALEVLKDVPNSDEYIQIYRRFRRCVFLCEAANSDNYILDNEI